METQTFTFHAKFGDAMKGLPRDAADELAAALVRFGCFGEEPDFENPYLAALFNMAREDIGYSIKKRSNGAKGGRPRNHVSDAVSEEVSEEVSETEKPESEEVSEEVSENEKAKQTNSTNSTNSTNNTNKRKGCARMARPTLAEVREYIAENGYRVDAEAFMAYYDSVGWRIGNKPMKSWRSALTTWELRDNPGGKAVQDADFSRFG